MITSQPTPRTDAALIPYPVLFPAGPVSIEIVEANVARDIESSLSSALRENASLVLRLKIQCEACENAETALLSARAAIIEECANVLGDRLESLRIMADRAGYTREGSDLAQQASATYDAIKTIRALASSSEKSKND